MSSNEDVLDADPSYVDNFLKFVKNELEDEFDSLFGDKKEKEQQQQRRDSIVVKPIPGLCIKCYKNRDEKFFINLCQTDAIPSPEDITEAQLTEILESDTPSSYRIPMSISEPRPTADKSGNQVDVCDIAINPKFFAKCQNAVLFRDFLVVIVLEALDDKYGIHIKPNNWIVLKNRKCIGYLVSHRIQNRDAKAVYESYQNPSLENKKKLNELRAGSSKKNLIQEITPTAKVEKSIPEHKFMIKTDNSSVVNEIFAEFFLPKCFSGNDLTLDIGEDRIILQSAKCGYNFDQFVEYNIDQERITAKFYKKTKMLQVTMPVQVAC